MAKAPARKSPGRTASGGKADLKEKSLVFGAREIIRMFKSKKKTEMKVFVAKDAREETKKLMENAGVQFETAKTRVEIAQDLKLDFFCEVYAVKQ